MAVTFGAIGTGANGATSCTPSYPAGITAASKLYCFVASGVASEATPTIPAGGWTLLGTLSGGSGITFGLDVGNRRVSVFKKDTVTGTESGTETVSLASGNTMRAHIVRIEHAASTTIKEHWTAGADSTHGTAWSVTGAAGLPWKVNGLLAVFTAQCIDSATQSAQAIAATGVTFGTRTNHATSPVTTGNDHRFVLDTIPVSAVVEGSAGAPTWTHTNSANASGTTGFLLLEEQQAAVAGQVFARGATTASKDPGGPLRTVQLYSRMGLVRGTPARKRGAFQFGVPTTNVAALTTARGASTGAKSIAGAVAGLLQLRGASSGTQLSGNNIAARFCPLASVGVTKIGHAAEGGAASFKGSSSGEPRRGVRNYSRMGIVRGIPHKYYGSTPSTGGRTVGNYSRMGLLRGAPSRLYGTFQRVVDHETNAAGRAQLYGATTAHKIMAADVAGRFNAAATAGVTKIGHAAVAGIFGERAGGSVDKTGHTAVAGFQSLRGQATYTLLGGRTVVRFSAFSLYLVPGDTYGSFARTPGVHVYGATGFRAATTEVKIGVGAELGVTYARGAITAGKVAPVDAAGRFSATAAVSFVKTALGEPAARVELRGTSTFLRITGPTYDVSGRLVLRGSVTQEKEFEEDALGTARARGASSSEKSITSAVAGLAAFRGSTTYSGPRGTDIAARAIFFGTSAAARVLSGIVFGRVGFTSSSTWSKAGSFDAASFIASRGASTASKTAESTTAGVVFPRAVAGYSLAFVPIGGGRRRIGVGSTAAAGGTIGSTAAGVGNKRIGSERG